MKSVVNDVDCCWSELTICGSNVGGGVEKIVRELGSRGRQPGWWYTGVHNSGEHLQGRH